MTLQASDLKGNSWLEVKDIMLLTDVLEKKCAEQTPAKRVSHHVMEIFKLKIKAKFDARCSILNRMLHLRRTIGAHACYVLQP
jgi:hypothetical protein